MNRREDMVLRAVLVLNGGLSLLAGLLLYLPLFAAVALLLLALPTLRSR